MFRKESDAQLLGRSAPFVVSQNDPLMPVVEAA